VKPLGYLLNLHGTCLFRSLFIFDRRCAFQLRCCFVDLQVKRMGIWAGNVALKAPVSQLNALIPDVMTLINYNNH
jgi:hypothetical protein